MATKRAKPRPGGKRTGSAHAARDRFSGSGLIRSERFRFAAVFGLCCLGFYGLTCVLPTPFAKFACEQTARTLGRALDAIGFPVSVRGNLVYGGGLTFLIVLECTAISAMGLFACFVSVSRAKVVKKALVLAVGLPFLYLGNLLRLVSVFAVSRYHPRLFDVVHVYVGQVFTMLLVVLACILWLRWANDGEAVGPAAKIVGFLARFVAISGSIFLLWIEIHTWYILLLDRIMVLGFAFFGYRLFIPYETAVYYETFSIVGFASLILASRSVAWQRKARGLGAGLGLFFLLHLFHRIDTALVSAFGFTSLFQLDVFLCDIGQYLLPVLLWLAVVAPTLPRVTKSPNLPRRSLFLHRQKEQQATL